ncbi:Ubiquitin-conjugating enzyme/RWD-like protein [Moelleriella libera RCEF 2490]|uniref:Ubiquitin-conjugating enzyme/RWD-like protein n=1 Tax=Moelleriella libera RCEF 2490 TaxID=1081109 RepID=A0A166RM07_9HYPO|nr:Ubiquitin-conjugating enzyme/RWD-like protein [Moelleriella libera RCEF 2490]
MSTRAFLADLADAQAQRFDDISGLRRGDSDGEICFEYFRSDVLAEPLEIQILATDVASYPGGSAFIVFTSSDACDDDIVAHLERISASTNGCRVQKVIGIVTTRLRNLLLYDEYGNNDEDSEEETVAVDGADDEYFDLHEGREPGLVVSVEKGCALKNAQRLHKDLMAARSAGFSIGIFANEIRKPVGIVSLSWRVSQLGISLAAMSAWGLDPSGYLVLLIKCTGLYPNLKACLNSAGRDCGLKFRFGQSHVPKPSLTSAKMAFSNKPEMGQGARSGQEVETDDQMHGENTFTPTYMSKTIDALLENHFFRLLSVRRRRESSWDEAQEYLAKLEGRSCPATTDSSTATMAPSQDIFASTLALSVLQEDHAMKDENDISIPLVAMEFALRRLCRCTEYCMVCHQRLRHDFEALKPYVCTSALCLYQYLSLNLGPNVEHEIVTSPYVVDMLISFFYAALVGGDAGQCPDGLALKVPCLARKASVAHIACDLPSRIFRVPLSGLSPHPQNLKIREGDWFFLVIKVSDGFERHTCWVEKQFESGVYAFVSVETYSYPDLTEDVGIKYDEADKEVLASGEFKSDQSVWRFARLYPFCFDPDDMERNDKVLGLLTLLNALPSVLEMRTYLGRASSRDLKSWQRLNPSSRSLLCWIIASNTSYLVQDTPVPMKDQEDSGNDVEAEPESGAIKGLEKSWMQFRFAQGSPQKEAKFLKIIDDMRNVDAGVQECPSLFAWHGSSLGNWHGIVREGLDFQKIINGRAFGDGVYFSQDMSVSRTYLRRWQIPVQGVSAVWRNSVLNVNVAISICEIVNRPQEFVSCSPHFVVDKTDWIQCRYLLLEVNPSAEARRQPLFVPSAVDCIGYVNQDPSYVIRGERGKPLEIPRRATTARHYWKAEDRPSEMSVVLSRGETGDDMGEFTLGDDPALLVDLIEESEGDTGRQKRHRIMTPTEANVELGSPQPVAKLQRSCRDGDVRALVTGSPPVISAFRPGALDLSSLPQLPFPDWATSSQTALRALSREIKELQKIQSKQSMTELGWYLDTSKVTNLFQWIIELHSFDADLPLAKDMDQRGCRSIVLEVRFTSSFPISPPFVRVIRPRFLPFSQGGGGHVTAGGAICSEMLTNSGWSPAMSMEKVFLQIRLGLCDTERPARLEKVSSLSQDYGFREAIDAYRRAALAHGWSVPEGFDSIWSG